MDILGAMSRRAQNPDRKRSRRKISAGRRAEGEQLYRLSDRAIRWWTIGTFIGMAVMIAAGILVAVSGSGIEDYETQDAVTNAGVWIAVGGGFFVPILVAAMVGGIALNKYGWIAGLLLGLGVFGWVMGSVISDGRLLWGGIAAVVVGGILYFVFGFIRDVPMWLQAPTVGSPRVYLNRPKDAPRGGEDEDEADASPPGTTTPGREPRVE